MATKILVADRIRRYYYCVDWGCWCGWWWRYYWCCCCCSGRMTMRFGWENWRTLRCQILLGLRRRRFVSQMGSWRDCTFESVSPDLWCACVCVCVCAWLCVWHDSAVDSIWLFVNARRNGFSLSKMKVNGSPIRIYYTIFQIILRKYVCVRVCVCKNKDLLARNSLNTRKIFWTFSNIHSWNLFTSLLEINPDNLNWFNGNFL